MNSANKLVLILFFIWVPANAHENKDANLAFLINSLIPSKDASMNYDAYELAKLMDKALAWTESNQKAHELKRKIQERVIMNNILRY